MIAAAIDAIIVGHLAFAITAIVEVIAVSLIAVAIARIGLVVIVANVLLVIALVVLAPFASIIAVTGIAVTGAGARAGQGHGCFVTGITRDDDGVTPGWMMADRHGVGQRMHPIGELDRNAVIVGVD